MSEKLEKLRAMLEKEKERRIKLNNRIFFLYDFRQDRFSSFSLIIEPEPGCAVRCGCNF